MGTQQVAFGIRGMFGPKCARDIEHHIAQRDGVIAAQVNYATERATVVYDPTRVTTLKMVNAVRSIGYDTPTERLVFHSDDLLYATSARAIERVIGNAAGVVQVSANLATRSVVVDVFPDNVQHGDVARVLLGLGFRPPRIPAGSTNGRLLFLLRSAMLATVLFLAFWSAGAQAGWFASLGSLGAPLVIGVIVLVGQFGVGLPFFRFAYLAAIQAEFDASVILALLASVLALSSLAVAVAVPTSAWAVLGLIASTGLTTAWFMARALSLWVLHRPGNAARQVALVSAAQTQLGVAKQVFIPVFVGVLAALAMVGIYLGILSVLQSPAHAFEQLVGDGVWVALVALGFGAQIGLYVYLRIMIHTAKAAGATAVTGAGTGTSTLGMLACCAHHLTDIAPLVGLTGAGGLSGAIGYFTEWKYAFIALGLVMNVIGIIVTLWTIRKSKAHLDAMTQGVAEMQAAPACH